LLPRDEYTLKFSHILGSATVANASVVEGEPSGGRFIFGIQFFYYIVKLVEQLILPLPERHQSSDLRFMPRGVNAVRRRFSRRSDLIQKAAHPR
jgi:hypothetical protein